MLVLFSEKTCRYKDILCSSIAEDDQDLLVKEASENNTAPTSECSNASDVPSSTTPQANESSAMLTLDTFDIKHTPTPLLRGWAPLLLSMMLELDQLEASAFAAYFALLPNLTTLKHPHLWPQEERVQLLSGSRLHDDVKTDLALMNAEYNDTAKPFMEAHPELFDTSKCVSQLQHILSMLFSVLQSITLSDYVLPLQTKQPFLLTHTHDVQQSLWHIVLPMTTMGVFVLYLLRIFSTMSLERIMHVSTMQKTPYK